MDSFELTITVQSNERVRARTRGGAEAEGSFQYDKLRRDTITIFKNWLSRGAISERRELEVLGTNLYEVLIDENVGALFEEVLDKARQGKRRLLVRLSFNAQADDELSNLPWEYLYYPEAEGRAGYFLCTYIDLVLSRYMPLGTEHQTLEPEESALHILLVVSNPANEDLSPLITGLSPAVSGNEVIQRIQALAGEEHPIKIDILDKPTVDNFLQILENAKPHVLHFIGYGRYDQTEKKGEIALLGPDEKTVQWIIDREFADYFVHMRSIPPVVVLHLWETLSTDRNANFAALAPALIRRNIPAVVAMQYPITKAEVIAFSRAFYRELAKGVTVDDAVQTGRWHITTKVPNAYDKRGFGTPVLYTHSSGSIVQGPGQQRTESSSETRSPLSQLSAAGHAADKADTVAENKPSLVAIIIKACRQRMEELKLSEEQEMRMEKNLSTIRKMAGKEASEIEEVISNWFDLEQDPKLEKVLFSAVKAVRMRNTP